jgi:hypothetical protein
LPPRGRQQYQALTRQLLLEATTSRAAADQRRRKRSAPERTSASIWLDRIEIENFRALQHLQLQFPRLDSTWATENLGSDDQEPWLVLLGNNGIGKSSILKALALALASPAERTRLVPDQRQLVTQGRGQRQGRVRLWFSDQRLPHEWVFGHGVKSQVAKSRAPMDMPVLGYGSTRLLPAASTTGATPKKFRTGSLFAPTEPLADAEPWFASASAVKRDPFNLAATDLKTLLSMDLNESLLRRRGQLWAHLYRKRLPVRELSDGFQSVLALALDLLFHFSASSHDPRAVEALVLIDEIEVHLHPTWKLRIVRDLRRIFRRARFIVTTHDPLCVQGLAPGELHVLTRDERSRAVHVRQADVPLGLRADQVLTGEWFGMGSTRDPDTRRLMTRHAELLRVGDPTGAQQEEQSRVEGVLRERLGRFGESPYERAGLQAYAELAPRIENLSPDEQQKRLQKRIRELLPIQR